MVQVRGGRLLNHRFVLCLLTLTPANHKEAFSITMVRSKLMFGGMERMANSGEELFKIGPKVSVELVRKRSEHNEGEISTLEELSLHQEDIEKIENLQNWCRELRILLLQSNLIPKIENIHKMKKLQYLNLALNNVERVENLERCESLEKLDLTLNFIGELTSISSLKENIHLHTLYLTGNPCTEYMGYRDYVIATLQQLQTLDSETILRSDRIKAIQNYDKISEIILKQQNVYKVRRIVQRQENNEKMWAKANSQELDDPEKMKKYWEETCDNSPETRVELATISRKQKEQGRSNQTGQESVSTKKHIKLFKDDGHPLNVNEPRIPFTLVEDDNNNTLVLTVEVYRHLDTSLIEADVQPKFVRATIKGKIFQIVLPEAVHPDKSLALRSQTTGFLVIKMPRVKERQCNTTSLSVTENVSKDITIPPSMTNSKREYLEIGKKEMYMDFSRIAETAQLPLSRTNLLSVENYKKNVKEKPVSQFFQENPDVPPLE